MKWFRMFHTYCMGYRESDRIPDFAWLKVVFFQELIALFVLVHRMKDELLNLGAFLLPIGKDSRLT